MDPNETLEHIRTALETMTYTNDNNTWDAAALDLAAYFEDLDDWMVAGGSKPKQWCRHCD